MESPVFHSETSLTFWKQKTCSALLVQEPPGDREQKDWLLSHLEPCLQSLVLEGQALSLRKVEEKFAQVTPAS